MGTQRTFRHSGRLGDIIYSLPAVRAAGGGALYLNADGRYGMGPNEASALMPLLQAQTYVTDASIWDGETYDFDLDAFRCHGPARNNLVLCHLRALGLDSGDLDSQWLYIGNVKPRKSLNVIFARGLNRRGVPGFWKRAYEALGHRSVFVGTGDEHRDFEVQVGPIRFMSTIDLLELARTIASAKLFVGSQSCPYAIAEGMKLPAILEVDPLAPNTLFERPGMCAVISTDDLAMLPEFASKVLSGELPVLAIPPGPLPDSLGHPKHTQVSEIPPWRRYWQRSVPFEAQEWAGLVPESAQRVLHLGCGTGQMGLALLGRNKSIEVWGIEADADQIVGAKKVLYRALAGDAERMHPLPIPEAYFDVAVLGRELSSIRDPEAFLRRLRPHLTDDATLVCGALNASHWSRMAAYLSGRSSLVDGAVWAWDQERGFTSSGFRELLFDAGYVPHAEWAYGHEEPVCANALAGAARSMGLSADDAAKISSILEWRTVARPAPDPTREENLARLLGPYVGELGPASCRCSVVILTYNSSSTITPCIESVLPTLGADDELILVDNASQDGTPDVLKQFGCEDNRIKVIVNDTNRGFSAGCNIGLLASQGLFLCLLNPDTQVCPNWLDRFAAILSKPEVGAVGPVSNKVSGLQFIRFHLQPQELQRREDVAEALRESNGDQVVPTKFLIGFCVGFQRGTLDGVGLLDEAMFLGSEDMEMSWRLRALGYDLFIATDVLVQHEGGVSFATMSSVEATRLRNESDLAFLSKLRRYYGQCDRLDSASIFGSHISDHLFSVPLES